MRMQSDQTYRDIILDKIEQNKHVKAYKTKMARAIGCTNSYISHVISKKGDLTPDQASDLCDFWGLDKYYSEYFLNLLLLERCNTEGLRNKITTRLTELVDLSSSKSTLVAKDIEAPSYLSARFYSKWYNHAILRSLDIKEIRTAKQIAEKLSLPASIVNNSLKLMLELNFVKNIADEWHPNAGSYSGSNLDTEFFANYHASLRQRAIEALEMNRDHVCYSAIYSVSKNDYKKIKESIRAFIKTTIDSYGNSTPEEELAAFSFDFFSL